MSSTLQALLSSHLLSSGLPLLCFFGQPARVPKWQLEAVVIPRGGLKHRLQETDSAAGPARVLPPIRYGTLASYSTRRRLHHDGEDWHVAIAQDVFE